MTPELTPKSPEMGDVPAYVAPEDREFYLTVRDRIDANVAALPDLDADELSRLQVLLRPGP